MNEIERSSAAGGGETSITSTRNADGSVTVKTVTKKMNPDGSTTEEVSTWVNPPEGYDYDIPVSPGRNAETPQTSSYGYPPAGTVRPGSGSYGPNVGASPPQQAFTPPPQQSPAPVRPEQYSEQYYASSPPEAAKPPETTKPPDGQAGWCTAKKRLLVVGAVVLVGAAVGLGVGLGLQKSEMAAANPLVDPAGGEACHIDGGEDARCIADQTETLALCVDFSEDGAACSAWIQDKDGTGQCCNGCSICPPGCDTGLSFDCTDAGYETQGCVVDFGVVCPMQRSSTTTPPQSTTASTASAPTPQSSTPTAYNPEDSECVLDGDVEFCSNSTDNGLSLCLDINRAQTDCKVWVHDDVNNLDICCASCSICPPGCNNTISFDCDNVLDDLVFGCDCPETTVASTVPATLESTEPTTTSSAVTLPTTATPTGGGSDAMAAVYVVQLLISTDDDGSCDIPTPEVLIRCGQGGRALVLDDEDTLQCLESSGTVSCTPLVSSNFTGVRVHYGCIGTSDGARSTTVDVTESSLTCPGVAGSAQYLLYLSSVCQSDNSNDFNLMSCDPLTLSATDRAGDSLCWVQTACPGGSSQCQDISITPVSASIEGSALSSDCLFSVSTSPATTDSTVRTTDTPTEPTTTVGPTTSSSELAPATILTTDTPTEPTTTVGPTTSSSELAPATSLAPVTTYQGPGRIECPDSNSGCSGSITNCPVRKIEGGFTLTGSDFTTTGPMSFELSTECEVECSGCSCLECTGDAPLGILYFAEVVGVGQDACDVPSPNVQVSCGNGGVVNLLNFTSHTANCFESAGGIQCDHKSGAEADIGIVYECVGTSLGNWETTVTASSDSVSCNGQGVAGLAVLIGQRCRPFSGDDNFSVIQCGSSDDRTELDNGIPYCIRGYACSAGQTCDMDLPVVSASVSGIDTMRSCLMLPND